jgi:hypothetical protein
MESTVSSQVKSAKEVSFNLSEITSLKKASTVWNVRERMIREVTCPSRLVH